MLSHGIYSQGATTCRYRKIWQILCELYAKLLAMVVQHWLLVASCWAYPDRSLVKGAQTVRAYALMLDSAMGGFTTLTAVLKLVGRIMGAGCRMNPRRRLPNTYQLLLGFNGGP